MIVEIIIVITVIVISMTLHEAAHGYVAYWLGDHLAKVNGRLTLNPLKHIDPIMSLALPLLLALAHMPIFGGAKPVPINPSSIKWGNMGVACVAIAGPLVNFILAYISFSVLYYANPSAGTLLHTCLFYAMSVNLGFCVFNMLPIPPLDGSRILYAFAPEFVQKFMEQMERYGIYVVMVLVLIFGSFLSTIMSGAIYAILNLFYKLVF